MRFFLIFFLLANFFSVGLFAADKTVDAPAYSKAIRDLYQAEDKIAKTPAESDYASVPGSKLWRKVRSGQAYKTQVRGEDSAVLINSGGEYWRLFRARVSSIGGIIIAVCLLIPSLLLLFFGRFSLNDGFSGQTIERFALNERIIHWGSASLFILLSLTGIALLIGKYLLMPIVGKEIFAIIASIGKEIHNFAGPIFSAFLLLMLITFFKDNLYQRGDINWLLKGGGLFGEHVDSHRFNLGEKAWFWIVLLVGSVITISGYMLLYALVISNSRELSELSHVFHSIGAIFMISALFGHIYMSLSMEGSMSAMTRGIVDKNWGKEHHSLWYHEKYKQ